MIQGSTCFRTRITLSMMTVLLVTVAMLPAVVLAAEQFAIPTDAKGLPLWAIAEWKDFPVLMELASHEDLDRLLQEVPIASFNREQVNFHYNTPKDFHLVFKPRVTEAEAEALTRAGYVFERVVDEDKIGRQMAEAAWARHYDMAGEELNKGIKEFTYWPTHAQIGTFLAGLEDAHDDICRTFSWGQSVQGRDLWGLVVSADPHNTTAEPEVRLSSTMHGDEVPGMAMLLNFAEYLVNNYGQPGYEDVTYLVNNYEIHIMPLHNPDGNTANQRSNANGVDLNRNYLLPAGTHSVEELENVNFMTYANNHNFVISINGHSGALVANYPWDYTPTLATDDEALKLLSLEYSTYNLPMYNGSFPQGITNGYDWYFASGTLQDWSYDQTDCIDVTMELHNTKWPSASTLPALWDENRESLMHYTKAARYGVNGVVTGSDSGLPLDATVTVTGISKNTHTDPVHGDYYKLLHTGSFDITFSAYGYISQTITDVATTWGTPTVLDVVLDPVAHGDVTGRVANLSGAGVDASVNVYSYPVGDYVTTVQATAAGNGAYSAHLVYGDYTLEAVSSGLMTQSAVVTIGATPVVQDFTLNGIEEVVLFFDDFESGVGLWTGGWGLSDPAEGYSSDNSMNDSPGGNYLSYEDNAMTMSEGVDLSNAMSGEVTFYAKWEIENSWDGCFFEVSIDGGGNWTPLASNFTNNSSGQGGQVPGGVPIFDNNQANWVLNTVNLSSYLNETDVRFRFRLVSDSSLEYSGFFVDDMKIEAVRELTSSAVPDADVLVAGVKAWPNPFNPQTTVKFTNPRSGLVTVGIYDLQGYLVRTLVQDQMDAGSHSVVWNGRTNVGGQAASGVYFARMSAGDVNATTKLMLVK
jgi:Zinc carboxypeptidase/Immune inhibitor A-like, MAM domain/FlgD Ig-like domain